MIQSVDRSIMTPKLYTLTLVISLLIPAASGESTQTQQKCRFIKFEGSSLYWIKKNSEWKKLTKNTLCKPGHTIKTLEKSELHLSFEPAITAIIKEKSVLSLDKLLIDNTQKAIRMRLNFQKGNMGISMPQNMGYSLLFAISTPTASLFISNADFTLRVEQNNATIIEVTRGSIKLLNNESEEKSVVFAGSRAVVLPGQASISVSNLADSLVAAAKKQPKPLSVAILSVYSKMLSKENLEPLSDHIAQEIEKHSNSEVLFLDEVRAMLRAEGIENLLDCSTDSCISKIGSYLGVDLVVIGRLGQLGNRYIFNLKIIDALRNRTKNRVSVVVDNDIGIVFNKVSAMVDTLIKGKIEPEPVTTSPVHELDAVTVQKFLKEMVWVFPGIFYMGSETKKGEIDELPKHKVALNGLYVDKHEVTRENFDRVMGYNPSKFKGCAACPVDNVSWFEAQEYCRKINMRLPTEAEWEYACRSGIKSFFHYGGTLSGKQANFNGQKPFGGVPKAPFRRKPLPVGSFKPNAWNLYDMHGNVQEWCSDWYDVAFYGNSPEKNPRGPKKGNYKVVRGGGWNSNGAGLRSANRISYSPSVRSNNIGFRCVKDSFE